MYVIHCICGWITAGRSFLRRFLDHAGIEESASLFVGAVEIEGCASVCRVLGCADGTRATMAPVACISSACASWSNRP